MRRTILGSLARRAPLTASPPSSTARLTMVGTKVATASIINSDFEYRHAILHWSSSSLPDFGSTKVKKNCKHKSAKNATSTHHLMTIQPIGSFVSASGILNSLKQRRYGMIVAV